MLVSEESPHTSASVLPKFVMVSNSLSFTTNLLQGITDLRFFKNVCMSISVGLVINYVVWYKLSVFIPKKFMKTACT